MRSILTAEGIGFPSETTLSSRLNSVAQGEGICRGVVDMMDRVYSYSSRPKELDRSVVNERCAAQGRGSAPYTAMTRVNVQSTDGALTGWDNRYAHAPAKGPLATARYVLHLRADQSGNDVGRAGPFDRSVCVGGRTGLAQLKRICVCSAHKTGVGVCGLQQSMCS